jgi:hypothetical protein
MNNWAVKLKITNSANDSMRVEWFFCEKESEKYKWIEEKKKEEDDWNYRTEGVRSTRFYDFSEYLTSSLMETDISELEGMTVWEFVSLIKSFM